MEINKVHIIELLRGLPFIECVENNGEKNGVWTLTLKFPIEGNKLLMFDMRVNLTTSPMKSQGSSPVKFFNPQLIAYPHIMHSGYLCMHTRDCVTWEDRIIEDVNALYEWIERYYIKGEVDEHYEDLVVENVLIKGRKKMFYYSPMNPMPKVGDYGIVAYTRLKESKRDNRTDTYLVQSLVLGDKKVCFGEWAQYYLNMDYELGLFVMLNGSPSEYDKFAVEKYEELERLCTDEQLEYLYYKLYRGREEFTPIFWGYMTPSGQLRWLISYPDRSQPLIRGKKNKSNERIEWKPKLSDGKMELAAAEVCSYEQFFGRGCLPNSIAEKRVLLLGVGAIGSIVAITLIRCGVRDITLSDFDDKHSGNVCRSEYRFDTGSTKKIDEMKQILESISPFVKVTCIEELHMILKHAPYQESTQAMQILDMFDIVIDCSIDSEMMWAIDQMETKAQVINLSISNGAREVVCAFSPNVSEFVSRVYTNVVHEESGDLYNPEGCWSPTFKASYNDVQVMVQYALRNIVKMLSGEIAKANFMIKEIDESLRLIRW